MQAEIRTIWRRTSILISFVLHLLTICDGGACDVFYDVIGVDFDV